VEKLKEIGSSQELTYTLHAPFASMNIAAPAEDMRNFVLKRLQKSMIFARSLECHLMVFHPGFRTGISGFYPGMDWKTNIKSVEALLELSRQHEVKIAVENCPEPYGFLLKNVEQFSRFFKELGENVSLVLDVGHSNITSQTLQLMKSFSEKIVHIHAHDNDGKQDLHQGVGYGTVNWQEFAESLKNIRFEGLVMVESYKNIGESIETLEKLFT